MPSSCHIWPPPKRRRPLHVFIASSILGVEENLELKTLKAGAVGRIAAVFRVDWVHVYRDPDSTPSDYRLLRLLLEYMATPPHLRRKIFPIIPELKKAGLLPPLRVPGHDLPREPRRGVVMEGLVEECSSSRCRVYLGSYGVGVLEGRAKPRRRIVVEIVDEDKLRVRRLGKPPFYMGFRVRAWPNLASGILEAKKHGVKVIGTSRTGACILESNPLDLYSEARGLALVFGGPRGSVVRDAGGAELFDAIYNTVPLQGTKTVRTEEALAATLSLVNILEARGGPEESL